MSVSDSTAHISWPTEQSKQLIDLVRHYLIQHNAEYVSHSVATYIHPKTQKHESYIKIATYHWKKSTQEKDLIRLSTIQSKL